MKKTEYVKFVQTGVHCRSKKSSSSSLPSVTDPSFAQTGRQMLENPILQDVRVNYNFNGGLNPDNPFDFKEFDKVNGDKFLAAQQAKEAIETASVESERAQVEQNPDQPSN